MAHAERATRRALLALPQGSWTAVDWLDDDGITTDPVRMQVTVTNRDGTFTVDFAGSAAATTGPVNMPFGATIAMCKVVLKALTSPNQPSNAGTTVPLEVRAEPGTLFHAVYPAPTFTLWTGIVALELIYKALAVGMPDRLPASSGGDVPGFMMVGIHPDTGEFFALSNNEVVGWGAAPRPRRHRRDDPPLREHRAQHADRGDGGSDRDALRTARDPRRLRWRRALPRRLRRPPRHRVHLRRRVPLRHQEDQEPRHGHSPADTHRHRTP